MLSSNKRSRIRLQFILPDTGGSNIGGMEMVAANILHRLDPRRYSVSLLCLNRENGVIPRLDRARVPVEVIEKQKGLDATLVPRLSWHFLRTRPDLIHTFNEGALIYGFPAARLARVPAVVHADHGRLPVRERPLLRAVRIRFTKMADHIVAVSEDLRRLMVEKEGVPEDKVTIVTNGVDLIPFDQEWDRASIRRDLGVTQKDWVVGTVGSLSPQKNQALLIRSAARVPNMKVLIAGAGRLEGHLETLIAELKLEDRVFCVGQQRDIPRFLSALDLFALPSITEGTSLALLEAMAARLPVLATDVGGNRAVLENTGLLVPSDDVDAMSDKLAWCRKHRAKCKALGLSGRARVEARYSLDRTVATYDEIFMRALGRQT